MTAASRPSYTTAGDTTVINIREASERLQKSKFTHALGAKPMVKEARKKWGLKSNPNVGLQREDAGRTVCAAALAGRLPCISV